MAPVPSGLLSFLRAARGRARPLPPLKGGAGPRVRAVRTGWRLRRREGEREGGQRLPARLLPRRLRPLSSPALVFAGCLRWRTTVVLRWRAEKRRRISGKVVVG